MDQQHMCTSNQPVLRGVIDPQVFTYLAVIQLLLWAPRLSLPAGLAGLTAGLLYHTNLGGMQHFSVPKRALALVGALEQQPSVSYAAISQTQQPNQRTQFPEQVWSSPTPHRIH